MPTINELLRDHVTLDVQCLDRVYLNGYVSILQMPGQLVTFLTKQRKQPVLSPALLEQITKTFLDQRFQAFFASPVESGSFTRETDVSPSVPKETWLQAQQVAIGRLARGEPT